MKRCSGWEEKECDQCYQGFLPDRRGQKLCSYCKAQEEDALHRHRDREDLLFV